MQEEQTPDKGDRMMSYWTHETSGRMKEVVLKFVNNEKLTESELHIIRWYIHQFADAMPSKPNDLEKILEMNQQELKEYNYNVLVCEWGIDPL